MARCFTGTLTEYEDEEGFDTILFGGHNLGLLAGPGDARPMLERLRAMANQGTRIVGANRDPYQTDNPDFLAYHQINRDRGTASGQIR